jgi:SAM-dependent methyltransferase
MKGKGPDEDRARTTRLCERLFEQWDPMFLGTVDPTREKRMDGIVRAVKTHFRGPIKVLDLGSGPGTLTARLIETLPKSRVVAVDTDPVILQVGMEALQRFGRRTTWVLADLRKRGWSTKLPFHRFDAAVSSLALHWLEEEEIRTLYRKLRALLRPGGMLVNGDFLPSNSTKRLGRSTERLRRAGRGRANQRAFRLEWGKWWGELEDETSMRAALEERRARMPGEIPPRRTTGPKIPVSLEAHGRALRDAGFRETTVRWEDGEFRVLVGVR